MIDPTRTAVIVNPAAAGGRVGRQWASIQANLIRELGDLRFLITEQRGHGVEMAEQAVREGYSTVLSLGGDGTHNEVINGIMTAKLDEGAITLGILPAGTGGDLRRLLNNNQNISEAAKGLATAERHPVDVGWVRFTSHKGVANEGYFINISSFGVGGLVDQIVNQSSKRLGGLITFYVSTIRALLQYEPARVRLVIDDNDKGEFDVTNIMICNGQYAGGGMHFGPDARLSDGLFDVVVVEHESLMRTISLTRKVYKGLHIEEPDVHVFRGAHVKAVTTGIGQAYLDVDGEAPGILPAEFRVLPAAIQMLNVRSEVL